MKQVVHVAVGVVVNAEGHVLLALRPDHVHQGGLWEFPGGKCETGESVEHALARELLEEVGIDVLQQQPFCLIRHDYGDKEVLLDVRKVTHFAGVAAGREGQPIRWASPASLDPAQFPAANRSIIRRLQLPRSIAITGPADSEQDFFERFRALLEKSPPMVHLRAPQLDRDAFLIRATRCLSLCRLREIRLLLNTNQAVAGRLAADGLHVSAAVLGTLTRRPVCDDQLFGASCHSLAELQQAVRVGADYAFLSPVRETASHPGVAALGWPGFQELACRVDMPVFALGGLRDEDISESLAYGGAGIAGISGWWPVGV